MPLLLLDLDNTLADRDAAFRHWMQSTLAAWDRHDETDRVFLEREDADGTRPRREFLAAVRDRFGRGEPVEVLLEDYRRLTLEGFPPMNAGAKQRLEAMRNDGWKLAVVTNGESGVQEATAERVGLTGLLDAFVVSATVGVRKPDPRIFRLAAEACGEPTRGAWMIGDSDADIAGAAASEMRSVWLARSRDWHRKDLRPDAIAASLTEALGIVLASTDSTNPQPTG